MNECRKSKRSWELSGYLVPPIGDIGRLARILSSRPARNSSMSAFVRYTSRLLQKALSKILIDRYQLCRNPTLVSYFVCK